MADATIIGYDMRACVCCGGFIISFSGQADTRLISIGSDVAAANNQTFPIDVKVDTVNDPNTCGGPRIKITRMARR